MSETISNDDVRGRYVIADETTELGYLSYTDRGDRISIDHTVVYPAFQGTGVASRLVRFALDELRETTTKRLDPRCSYVVSFLSRHPEYVELTQRGESSAT